MDHIKKQNKGLENKIIELQQKIEDMVRYVDVVSIVTAITRATAAADIVEFVIVLPLALFKLYIFMFEGMW